MNKDDILKEFPLKTGRDGEPTTWPDFMDLQRIIKSQKLSGPDMEFFRREVIARREARGLPAGYSRRKLVDGKFSYVAV